MRLAASLTCALALFGRQPAPDAALEQAARAVEQGKPAEAERQLESILKTGPGDLRALILMGAALDAQRRYRDAGPYYERALKLAPASVQVLNNAGNHFLASGNRARARALYARVLALSPGYANAGLQLARMSVEDGQGRRALQYLGRLGASGSADPNVRLLRARALGLSGRCAEASAIAREMESTAGDSSLLFSAGMVFAQCSLYRDSENAFSAALSADPRSLDALYNLGWAALRAGHLRRAASVLETALAQRPRNADFLYTLSQAYLAQNRPFEAAALLVKAEKAAPARADILLLLAQVAAQLDFYGDAAAAYGRYLRLRPSDAAARRQRGLTLARAEPGGSAARAGLVEYLSLPPAEQRARYLAWLRSKAAATADEESWKLKLAGELLSDGQSAEAVAVLAPLRSAAATPAALAEAGRVLLEYEQYEPARQFLEAAVSRAPSSGPARLDLAIALFQLHQPETALEKLDETPAPERKGDYYLLRAQILDALGKPEEAAGSLNRGMEAAPTRPGLYFQAAGFLLKHEAYPAALSLLQQACRILPDARELFLARAVTLIHLKRTAEAQNLLAKMQERWPEWERPYLLNGILLELERHSAEARKLLQTAIALGADTAEAHYYEALATSHAAPEDRTSAENAIARALALSPRDPYLWLLAGKIALAGQDYPTAIRRLLEAIRLQPEFIPARYLLITAYRGAGEREKAVAQAEVIKRLSSEKSASDRRPFSEDDFLFAVRLPPGPAEGR